MATSNRSSRGLGSPNMSAQKKREIQSKGGKASPQNFKRNRELARAAGRKGGKHSHANQYTATRETETEELRQEREPALRS